MKEFLTIGPAAQKLGVLESQLRRLCNRNAVPFKLAGTFRLFDPEQLDQIRAACVKAGYLPTPQAAEVGNVA